MSKMFSTRILSLWFFILSAVANASVSIKDPETIRFPKDLGPVQFFETPTRYIVVDARGCGSAKLCTGVEKEL